MLEVLPLTRRRGRTWRPLFLFLCSRREIPKHSSDLWAEERGWPCKLHVESRFCCTPWLVNTSKPSIPFPSTIVRLLIMWRHATLHVVAKDHYEATVTHNYHLVRSP